MTAATSSDSGPAETVRRIMELWDEGRVDAALALLHPELEWQEPPESPDRTIVRGREAALAAVMLWLSTWSTYENELHEITAHGDDKALAHYRQKMTGATSGLPVEGDLFMVWTVRDGLGVRMAMYTSREEALADLG